MYLNELGEVSALDVIELGGENETGTCQQAPIRLVDQALQNDLLKVDVRLSQRPQIKIALKGRRKSHSSYSNI